MAAMVCYAQEALVKPADAVTLSEAHIGSLEIDTRLLDSYGRLPEKRRTFYLTAREHLADYPDAVLTDSVIVRAAAKAGLSLISGPMLGDVSESSISVWFRPVCAEMVTLQVTDEAGKKKTNLLHITRPGAAVRARLTELQANTRYVYQIVSSSGRVLGKGSFKTAPKSGAGETISIAFGSCFHKIGLHNPALMRLIRERGNRAMLLLGDLAVDDRETRFNFHYSDYLLRDVSKPWQLFTANVPVYAAWDDHDYLNNDKSGLQQNQINDNERRRLRRLWLENWNNPTAADENDGIYFNTVIGDVEILMLDTRSCRNWQSRNSRGSFLGDKQMQWLVKTLKASRASFILLTSGTMWSDFMSRAKDSWGTWDQETREEIYRVIEENKIGGVLLLSGDRHGARGFRIERPSGFVLHEFEAATLGGVSGPEALAPDSSAQLFGYAGGLKAFGEFSFDMGRSDPEVTFRLIDETGVELEKHIFRRSELMPEKH